MAEHKMRDNTGEWFGSIPVDWTILALKYAFSIKKDIAGKLGYTVLSVTQKGIKPKDMLEKGQFAMDYSKYQVVNRGEFIMNHMDLLTGWVDIAQESGVTSPDYRVFYNTDPTRFFSEYYKYIFQFCYSNRVFYGMGQGVAGFGRWRLPSDMFLRFLLPVPQIDEQKAIATYLDEQCVLIDEAIAEAKASIEEYKAWKASIIFETTTKGLHNDVEMRECPFGWLISIPKHWLTFALHQIAFQVKNKNSRLNETNLLSLSYGKIKRKDINTTDGLLPASFDGYNIIENGDIVLRLTDLQNDHTSLRVGRSTERGIITSAYVTLRTYNPSNSKYLYYLLHSFDILKGFYGMGSGVRQGLNYDEVKELKIVLPPQKEQEEITEYLDQKCDEIDSIISQKQVLISNLESYKRSLIYEAVTGKRKVE